ncbi:hypothetical protein G5I_05481 [Acromyrmex echinatior]|uniref:Uncharacterized protein n=1 Tax=Acromyrmex echinatior TaxID=103372 RepID=F4WIF7_ACREC|nr:hypothetical protein G5I_05481 [Acromyrmex echinatior]
MSTNVAAEASRPVSLPACQPASSDGPPWQGRARAAGSPARIRGVAVWPIAALLDATAGQSARAAVTTRAKYSRYISRPVATANYPQSRAGGRRRRLSGYYLERRADLSACAVREVRTRLPDTEVTLDQPRPSAIDSSHGEFFDIATRVYTRFKSQCRDALKLDVRPIASAIWIDLRGFYSHGLAIAQGRDATNLRRMSQFFLLGCLLSKLLELHHIELKFLIQCINNPTGKLHRVPQGLTLEILKVNLELSYKFTPVCQLLMKREKMRA